MGAEDRNEAVVRRFWDDVWVRGNFDVLREVTTEDFRCYAEPFAMDRRGMQWMIEAREFAAHYLGTTQFPPTPFVIDRIVRSGDTVSTAGHWVGLPATDWSRLLPFLAKNRRDITGLWLEEPHVTLALHEMRDGKTARQWITGLHDARLAVDTIVSSHEARRGPRKKTRGHPSTGRKRRW